MPSKGRLHCLALPLMPLGNGYGEVFVSRDVGGQPVAHDLYEVAAGEQVSRIAKGHALFGQKHGGDHDHHHVIVPGLPTT